MAICCWTWFILLLKQSWIVQLSKTLLKHLEISRGVGDWKAKDDNINYNALHWRGQAGQRGRAHAQRSIAHRKFSQPTGEFLTTNFWSRIFRALLFLFKFSLKNTTFPPSRTYSWSYALLTIRAASMPKPIKMEIPKREINFGLKNAPSESENWIHCQPQFSANYLRILGKKSSMKSMYIKNQKQQLKQKEMD